MVVVVFWIGSCCFCTKSYEGGGGNGGGSNGGGARCVLRIFLSKFSSYEGGNEGDESAEDGNAGGSTGDGGADGKDGDGKRGSDDVPTTGADGDVDDTPPVTVAAAASNSLACRKACLARSRSPACLHNSATFFQKTGNVVTKEDVDF